MKRHFAARYWSVSLQVYLLIPGGWDDKHWYSHVNGFMIKACQGKVSNWHSLDGKGPDQVDSIQVGRTGIEMGMSKVRWEGLGWDWKELGQIDKTEVR